MKLKDLTVDLNPPYAFRTYRRWKYGREHVDIGAKPRVSDASYQVDFKRVKVADQVYFVPEYASGRPASRSILSGQYYEPRTHMAVETLLKLRPGNVIHAGTFFGDMLPSFSRKCPGTVYAFEPVLESYVLARQCVEENDLSNVVLQHAALGNELSLCHLRTVNHRGRHSGGLSRIAETGQIATMIRIDGLGLGDLSVLQLDVEGHEVEALRGASQTIATLQPFVLVEDNAENCPEHFAQIGYRLGGTVPGLSIWSHEDHASMLEETLRQLG